MSKQKRPSLRSRRRRRIAAFLAVSLCIVAALVLKGCNSYGWLLFKENMLHPTPYLKPTHKPTPAQWSDDELTLTWIGHATVLINFYGTTILTDPMLADRMAPPHLGKGSNMGIRRITQLPLKFKDLPPIDLVLLSHAHHDHWDEATLKYFDANTEAIISFGNSDLVPKGSFGKVTELDWGQQTTACGLTIRAFRVEHWGYRRGAANKVRGFNGYVISGRDKTIAFFGDTAFGDRTRLIPDPAYACQPRWIGAPVDWSKRVGLESVDICILPIGDYYYHLNHTSPEEAWSIFRQVGGKWFLPIHWRTFILVPRDKVPTFEPIERLRAVADDDANRIICDDPGEEFVLP